MDRKTWSSKVTYILAVAGATVGFSAISHRSREADRHTLYHIWYSFYRCDHLWRFKS
nr:hypothetical protein [uncultured Campylobacter sp.]